MAGLSNKDPSAISDDEFAQLCHDDPLFFLEACCKIVDKQTRKLVPFRLNREQMDVFRWFWAVWSGAAGQTKGPVRFIILKARQMGISTMFEGLGYWMASTRSNTKGLVISHQRESSAHIFEMAERFSIHDTRHERQLMPSIRRSSRTELAFGAAHVTHRANDPGLGSSLAIACAESRNAGHSWTGSFFHGSEVARWKHPDILTGVLNALTESEETVGVLESTAHGASGVFYEIWQDAVAGKNEWKAMFLPWKDRPEYQLKLTPKQVSEFVPTKDEELLIQAYGLNANQLAWRRQKIASPAMKEEGRDPVDVFREQFPLTPEEAFIHTSGRQFFDMKVADVWEKKIRARENEGNVPKIGHLLMLKKPGPHKPDKLEFIPDGFGPVTIWFPPEPGEDYVIGADVGAGTKDGDFSVAYVLHRKTEKCCARIRARLDPDIFRDELIKLAWHYNQAFLAPEANNIGVTVARGCAREYPRVAYYIRLDEFGYGEPDPERPGWYTTVANRKDLFWSLRAAIRDGEMVIYCKDFWREAKDFIVPEDSMGRLKESAPRARLKKHDDCVMALAIAKRVNDPAIAGPIRTKKVDAIVTLPPMASALSNDIKTEDEVRKKRRMGDTDIDDHIGSL